jgi:hypothetical protein
MVRFALFYRLGAARFSFPGHLPLAFAFAMPSSCRSRRRLVSNSANTPSMSRKHLPAAVPVSIGCSVAFRTAPRARTVRQVLIDGAHPGIPGCLSISSRGCCEWARGVMADEPPNLVACKFAVRSDHRSTPRSAGPYSRTSRFGRHLGVKKPRRKAEANIGYSISNTASAKDWCADTMTRAARV